MRAQLPAGLGNMVLRAARLTIALGELPASRRNISTPSTSSEPSERPDRSEDLSCSRRESCVSSAAAADAGSKASGGGVAVVRTLVVVLAVRSSPMIAELRIRDGQESVRRGS